MAVHKAPFFSLILCTVGRRDEVQAFLESLTLQNVTNFEVILVDQNKTLLLEDVVEHYQNLFKIVHIKSSKLGLSYNRNLGIQRASGDILAFPDDDCEYGPGLLKNINALFENHPSVQIFSILVKDKISDQSFLAFPSQQTQITKTNIFKTIVSMSFFIRFLRKEDIHFDERLGVGAEFGSTEETDLIAALLDKNYDALFEPNQENVVYHPFKDQDEAMHLARAYPYGLGLGAYFKKEVMLRKNKKALLQFMGTLIRAIGGVILTKRRKAYWHSFRGRFTGFLSYKIQSKREE